MLLLSCEAGMSIVFCRKFPVNLTWLAVARWGTGMSHRTYRNPHDERCLTNSDTQKVNIRSTTTPTTGLSRRKSYRSFRKNTPISLARAEPTPTLTWTGMETSTLMTSEKEVRGSAARYGHFYFSV